MPVPNRLSELLRQRELIKEQLAWVEREIEATSAKDWPTYPAADAKPDATESALRPPETVPAPAALNAGPAMADEIIDQYRVAPDALKTDLRKGCLLYFVGALALVALGVGLLYLVFNYGK